MLKEIKIEDIDKLDITDKSKEEVKTVYGIMKAMGSEPEMKLHTQIKCTYVKFYVYDENLRRYVLEERVKVR